MTSSEACGRISSTGAEKLAVLQRVWEELSTNSLS